MCIHAQSHRHTHTHTHGFVNAQRQTDTHAHTHMHNNAPAACHWQVKCNQSLFLFLLSFLTPLLLSALVSGFHAALCSIDPDSALIACPLKWNYLDIDIVECSTVSLGCNWWRTALTEGPNTISTERSTINTCNLFSPLILFLVSSVLIPGILSVIGPHYVQVKAGLFLLFAASFFFFPCFWCVWV